MTRIIYEFGGNAPAVVLTQSDRDAFKAALKSVNVGELTKNLGIQRTYLYALLKADQIELLRFGQLCKALNLQLISNSDINVFLTSVKRRLE